MGACGMNRWRIWPALALFNVEARDRREEDAESNILPFSYCEIYEYLSFVCVNIKKKRVNCNKELKARTANAICCI